MELDPLDASPIDRDLELSGGSQVSTAGGGFDVDVESVYEIDFSVSDPTPYRVTLDIIFNFESGEVNGGPAIQPGTGAGVRLLLSGLIPVFEYEVSFDLLGDLVVAAGPTSLVHTGTLQPGSVYTFTTWIRSDRQAFADGAIEYSLVQVPEPATALLIGIGLVALAGMRGTAASPLVLDSERGSGRARRGWRAPSPHGDRWRRADTSESAA